MIITHFNIVLVVELKIIRCHAKAKTTNLVSPQKVIKTSEKYIKKTQRFNIVRSIDLVHKGDELSTHINMRVQIYRELTSTNLFGRYKEVHTIDIVSSLCPTNSLHNQNSTTLWMLIKSEWQIYTYRVLNIYLLAKRKGLVTPKPFLKRKTYLW